MGVLPQILATASVWLRRNRAGVRYEPIIGAENGERAGYRVVLEDTKRPPLESAGGSAPLNPRALRQRPCPRSAPTASAGASAGSRCLRSASSCTMPAALPVALQQLTSWARPGQRARAGGARHGFR